MTDASDKTGHEAGHKTGQMLSAVRATKPLVHHMTNLVVMNETANMTLAFGALPVMAHASEEVEEMVGLASALLLNIGTLTPELVDSMILAGKAADSKGIPVVLDPVGVGATRLRTDSAKRILAEVDIALVRGNAAEITALAGGAAEVRGVESVGTYETVGETAASLASGLGAVVCVTGAEDLVTDGERTARVRNGHPMMGTVTGTGCMCTTAIACFAGANDGPFEAAVAALVAYGVAGEDAAVGAKGPGSFHVALYDAVAGLDAEAIDERAVVVSE